MQSKYVICNHWQYIQNYTDTMGRPWLGQTDRQKSPTPVFHPGKSGNPSHAH